MDASALPTGRGGRGRELNTALVDTLDVRVRACEAIGSPDRIYPCSCTCAGRPWSVQIAGTVVPRIFSLTDTNWPAKNSVEDPLVPKTVGLCETNRPARNSSEFLATNFPAKDSILGMPVLEISLPARNSVGSLCW